MRAYRDWSKEGLCRDISNSAELFDKNPRRAKNLLCSNCPVAGDCLQYAVIYGERGIWGNTTFEQRQALTNYRPSYRQALIREAQNLGLYEHRYSIAQYQEALRSARGSSKLEEVLYKEWE